MLSPALDQPKDVSLDFLGLLIIFLAELEVPDVPQSVGSGGGGGRVFLRFGRPGFVQFCLFRPLAGREGMRDTRLVI